MLNFAFAEFEERRKQHESAKEIFETLVQNLAKQHTTLQQKRDNIVRNYVVFWLIWVVFLVVSYQ